MVNIENLIRLATLVRDETGNKQNTALRVGGTFLEVVYAIRDLLETVGELDTLAKGLNTRTRFFHGSYADVDALKNKTDLGVYVATTNGWTGLLSVQFDFYSTVSQVALSSSTPDYSEGSLAWKPAPCVMFRTYTNGTWSAWRKAGADVVNDLVAGGKDKALSAEQGKVLKEILDYLWHEIYGNNEETETEEIEADGSDYNSNASGNVSYSRWRIYYLNLQNGDFISVNCNEGWEATVFLTPAETSGTITKTYNGYASGLYTMTFEDAANSSKCLKVLVKKSSDEDITETEVYSNVSVKVERSHTIPATNGILNRLNVAESDLDELSTLIKGTSEEVVEEEVEPDGNEFNVTKSGVQDTRWRIFYYNLLNGDLITVNCKTGWEAYVLLTPSDTSATITKTYQEYSTGTFTMTFADADNSAKCFKILFKKTDGSSFTAADVAANVSASVTRTSSSPQADSVLGRLSKLESDADKDNKKISILFIGNSLTQDAVTYVPLVLKEIAPTLSFNIHIWYNGGKTLTQQYNDYFLPDNACQIYSICTNDTSWTNFSNSVKMSTVLNAYTFDIICIQEYFNYKSEYSTADKQILKTVIDYLRTNYSKPFKLVTLFHQPLRSNAESVFNLTKTSIDWMLKNSAIESVIPSGIAIYRAMATSLDSLGDQGHLSPDGTHAQEGLPCLLQAWVTCLWILNQVEIVASVNNSTSRVTTANYASINVPGPNLGKGVVVGTNAQDKLAMDVAIYSYNEGRRLEAGNI